MRISPSPLALFLGLAGDSCTAWQLEDDGLRVLREPVEESLPFDQVEELRLKRHLISSSLSVRLKSGRSSGPVRTSAE